ncbi:hypothetical protein FRC08_016562 [Ceratobasidium sp. 394]|nr:hypothetical protein FRC08_016562 [Ceratobasidium sp. 394]
MQSDSFAYQSTVSYIEPLHVFLVYSHATFQRLAIENRSPMNQSWQLSLPTNDCSLDFWPRLDEVYLTKCKLDQQVLPQLVSIHEPKILWVHEPRWDGQARNQVVESLRQYSVKLVWVDNWNEMPDASKKFTTGCFLIP